MSDDLARREVELDDREKELGRREDALARRQSEFETREGAAEDVALSLSEKDTRLATEERGHKEEVDSLRSEIQGLRQSYENEMAVLRDKSRTLQSQMESQSKAEGQFRDEAAKLISRQEARIEELKNESDRLGREKLVLTNKVVRLDAENQELRSKLANIQRRLGL